jgi:hypothetical protein
MKINLPDPGTWTNHDWANAMMIVLFGWFILFAAAEAHAWTHPVRNGRVGARQGIGLVVTVVGLFQIADRRSDPDVGVVAVPALVSLGLVALGAVFWFVAHLVDRDRFPWGQVPLAIAAPVADIVLLQRMLEGRLDPAIGWTAIWLIAAFALAVNILLGALLPRRRRAPAPATAA